VSRIFITGSVDGLGRAAAAALMDKGHDVVLHARSRQRAAPARGDVEEVSRSLLRLVTIVGRYLQDMATTPSQVPGNMPVSTGPWDRACGQAREALTNSAGDLIGAGHQRRRWPAAPSASPLARCGDQVDTFLTAGRDLLHTHFAPGPKGWVHRSPWAPAIGSERVNRALLAELGSLAARSPTTARTWPLRPSRAHPKARTGAAG